MIRTKFRWAAAMLSMILLLTAMTGCSSNRQTEEDFSKNATRLELLPPEESEASSEASSEEDPGADTSAAEQTTIRLAAMKGPTAMGLVKLLEDAADGGSSNTYDFTLAGTADEIVPLLTKGELDIAAVPCNLASVLYNNTQGQVKLAAVNTLGVLYIVETGESVQSMEDLRGKTILATGKGTTPEYAINYLLSKNGIDPVSDVTIEYLSEATQVAAEMQARGNDTIAMLPEPYVTTLKNQNDQVRTALSLTEEWDRVGDGSTLVTGVVVVRSDFLQENKAAVDAFLEEYSASVDYINANTEEAAQLVGKYDIVPAAVAQKALPACNITFLEGDEMKMKVSGYLQTLFDQNPKSVGGQLPDDAFYYKK